MSFASVYPLLHSQQAEKKGRTKTEVDEIIRWLTGYNQQGSDARIRKKTDFETFFADAPQPECIAGLDQGCDSAVSAWKTSKSQPCGRSATSIS